ncbi:NUDIX domain-containing protein [Thalassotalea mangrovi]|uniref:NUDIX hydrolase n=1 Tax=Thalassotalea mangrovi TaxID=2572245 RepID=A0A4U1B5X7_9GAMM|nr:NUDIX domain-containing protein [Thalassotalea mangrovi]TKB45863.1 NUDIX hydrolase [Thalassotalea mangrovi]
MKLWASLSCAVFLVVAIIGYGLHGGNCQNPGFIGAGTTVYKIDSQGEVHLLLAYERGRGWTSFGGGPKPLTEADSQCESPRQTAVRETLEESRLLLDEALLHSAVKDAKSYANATEKGDYITFVIAVNDDLDLSAYDRVKLPNDPGYYETSGVAWVPLKHIRKQGRNVATPNGEPLWSVFHQQFEAMLTAKPEPYWFENTP